MIYFLLALALALTFFHMRERVILWAFAASMTWLSMGIWLFFSTTPLLDISQSWNQILAWVFVILTFIPWVNQMNTEIRREAGGKSWKEYGPRPTAKISGYEKYKEELRRRTRR